MKKYTDFYRTKTSSQSSYFIGANTKAGFRSDAPFYFNEELLNKFYIIKGGPGTGKSTIMKNCAKEAEQSGANVTYLFCSSDPDSLDGIIISKNGVQIAICDGTHPHVADSSLPGCCGEIIDCGIGWDSSKLSERRDDIACESARKSICFERCYAYLSAADKIKSAIRSCALRYTDTEKMQKAIRRIIRSIPRQKRSYDERYCTTQAISMNGGVRLSTFEGCTTLIGIKDFASVSPIFFSLLSEELKNSGRSREVSVSPVGDICEIRLPQADIAFVPFRSDMVYTKVLQLKNYIIASSEAECRSKRKFNEKCFTEMVYCASDALAEARDHHFALEKIYCSAMDFSAIDKLSDGLCKRIKGYIK